MTEKEIERLYKGEVITFHEKEKVGAALYYPDNEGNFIVLVISNNQYGGDIQQRIGWLLLALIVISAVLIYFVGKLYAIRMVDRIDAAYQSEKAFISNASHELNNPLTAIPVSYTHLGQEEAPAPLMLTDSLQKVVSVETVHEMPLSLSLIHI